MIIFIPVIEGGKEAVRNLKLNEWYLGMDNVFRQWLFNYMSIFQVPIYLRVDLEVDPIKDIWDQYQKHNVIDNVGPYIGARKFFLAIQTYIQKVYGEVK